MSSEQAALLSPLCCWKQLSKAPSEGTNTLRSLMLRDINGNRSAFKVTLRALSAFDVAAVMGFCEDWNFVSID